MCDLCRPAVTRSHSKPRVPHHIRLGAFMESTGWLNVLEIVMAIGSLYTVVTYIADTYTTLERFKLSDFVMGIVFAVDWLFRLYISQSRLVYIFAWGSVVDVATFLPMLLLTMVNLDAFMLVMFRLLRVMRIFRCASCAAPQEVASHTQ
jgi:hypothetical protein